MSRHAEVFSQTSEAVGTAAIPKHAPAMQPRASAEHGSDEITEISRLVQSIFRFGKNDQGPRAVGFCGVNRGVGSSWICAKTAESVACNSAESVCLVDANLRAPSLAERFGLKEGPGFTELIRSSRPVTDFVQKIPSGGLWIVTAGSPPKEFSAVLNAERLGVRLRELRREFEFLLVDAPATDRCSDALLLGQLTDGMVLVAGSNSTRREAARNAKLSFETAQIPVLGVVLNKRTFPIPESIYRRI
jgi:Mrp family chromosome partitioning ATPase